MTLLAATICWGVGLWLGQAPPAPARPVRAVRPVSRSAPPLRPYTLTGTTNLDPTGAPVSLVAGHSHLIVVKSQGAVSSRAFSDLHEVWTWNVEVTPAVAPVAGDGLVFIQSASLLYALDEETGTVRWRGLTDGHVQPVWSPGWCLVASEKELRAHRTSDGSIVWRAAMGAVIGSVALDGDSVFVALADRRLVALNVRTGEQLWTTTLDVTATNLLAANERLYFGADDGNLYCYRQERGQLLWGTTERVGVVGRPRTDGVRVFYAGFDNSVRARDARSGNLRWHEALTSRPTGDLFIEGGHIVIPLVSGELELALLIDGHGAGQLAPLKPATDEGVRLEGVAAAEPQMLFGVTQSLSTRVLTMFRAASLATTPVETPPGTTVPLRSPGVTPARH